MCAKAQGTKATGGFLNFSPNCERDNIETSLHKVAAVMASGHVTHWVFTKCVTVDVRHSRYNTHN